MEGVLGRNNEWVKIFNRAQGDRIVERVLLTTKLLKESVDVFKKDLGKDDMGENLLMQVNDELHGFFYMSNQVTKGLTLKMV